MEALLMDHGDEFKVINLRQRRIEKKYKKLFDLYNKFTSFFRNDKQPDKKYDKKIKHNVQKPMIK
jgi:hypothetical protein